MSKIDYFICHGSC